MDTWAQELEDPRTEPSFSGPELRILNGPQRGASLPLERSRYLLGRGDNCDIVLKGAGVADEHLFITVEEDGFTVELLADGRVMAGVLEAGSQHRLPLGDVISMGQVQISVSQPDAPWVAGIEEIVAAPPVKLLADEPLPMKPSAKKKRYRPVVLAVSTVGLIAGASYVLLDQLKHLLPQSKATTSGLPVVTQTASAAQTHVKEGRNVLALHRVEETVRLEPNATGATARGIVANAQIKRAVTGALVSAGFKADKVQLATAEEVRQKALSKFSGRYPKLDLNVDAKGTAKLWGLIDDESGLSDLAESLTEEIAELNMVEFKALNAEEIRIAIPALLKSAGLNPYALLINEGDYAISLESTLNENDSKKIEQTLINFAQQQQSVIPLRWENSRQQTLPAKVIAVAQGKHPYIILADGERVLPGGEVGGLRFKLIRDNLLVFENSHNTEITFPIDNQAIQ